MSREYSKRRVVVTGWGMITSLGKNTQETFASASRGVSGIDFIKSFETKGLPCTIGGEVKDIWLDEIQAIPAQRFYKFSSRGLRLMRKATLEAAELARLDEIKDREKIGVSLGFHGDNQSVEDIMFLHRFYDGNGMWDMNGLMKAGGYSSLNFLRRKPDIGTSILSILFDCKGPNLSVVSACSAGSQAIGEACRIIQEGKSDVMIAGGCESTLNFLGFVGFVLIKALAERYTAPQKASRPFDRKRNGFVMSEGAGALVLEDLDHARSRGVPILGEILGYGTSADAYRITDIHPKGLGAIFAMRGALDDASLAPEDIDYINAHGTSTLQNDVMETLAIKEVFGKRAQEIPVSSNKSMLGHAIAAAGAIECILTLVGIQRSIILPTINYEYPDPKCDLDYVPNEARMKEHRRAISNSFGFGGQNACLCVGGFDG
ncbi:MAG TPA: beta-ketoacyl-[acyl-carrier-protein] synthase II [Nitrospiraceae bacterium]|nr:beta-ketoacyl-[acyl-carrier-protein] synthase II [Nitrospiraceae bacterium]